MSIICLVTLNTNVRDNDGEFSYLFSRLVCEMMSEGQVVLKEL